MTQNHVKILLSLVSQDPCLYILICMQGNLWFSIDKCIILLTDCKFKLDNLYLLQKKCILTFHWSLLAYRD